jgi:hypothetical protein
MNHIHTAFPNKPGNAIRVGDNANGIFGRGGKRNERAANTLDFTGHPASFAKHKGAPASAHHGFGNLHRRQFGASRIQPGNDLKHSCCVYDAIHLLMLIIHVHFLKLMSLFFKKISSVT